MCIIEWDLRWFLCWNLWPHLPCSGICNFGTPTVVRKSPRKLTTLLSNNLRFNVLMTRVVITLITN